MKHTTALLLTLTAGCMSSSTTAPTNPDGMPTAGSPDTGTNGNIFGLHDSGTAWEDADGGLVMVPKDAGTDAQEPLDGGTPSDAATDAEPPMLDAGPDAADAADAAGAGQTCTPCAADVDCAAGYACKDRPIDSATECFLRLDTGIPCPGGTEPKITHCLPTNFTPCSEWLGA